MDRFRAWLRKVFTPEPSPLDIRKPYVAYLRLNDNPSLLYLSGGPYPIGEFGLTRQVEKAFRFDTEQEAIAAVRNYNNGQNAAYNGAHRVQR